MPDGTLRRQLGVGSAAALVISNMIGTGIFVSTPFFAGDLGSVPLVLAIWVAGALVALAGACCYAELGVNYPDSGGEYVYLREAFGPAWAFMSGWTSFFVGFSCAIAAAALAFARYVGYFSEALVAWEKALACALILGMTLVNLMDLRGVARFQNVATSFKVITLLLLVLGGFLFGEGSWAHFSQEAVRTSDRALWAQFAVSLCFVYTSYSGWNSASYIAGEIAEPSRNLPRALALGTCLVALLYVVLNLVFIYAMPLETMKAETKLGAAVAAKLFGAGIGGAFAAAMAIALFSTVNAMVTVGPRVYYAMAKDRAFFALGAKVSAHGNSGEQYLDSGRGGDVDYLDAIAGAGFLYWLLAESLHRADSGFVVSLPAPRGLGALGGSGFLLSADSGAVHRRRALGDEFWVLE